MRAQHGPAFVLVGLISLLLTACGGGGGGGSPPNKTPTADAGANQTVKRNATVTLDGRGSADSDGDALAYRWTQTSGTPVTLNSSTSATPSFNAPNQSGTLSFSLVANDGKSDSQPATVSVTVQNTAPTAVWATAMSVGLGSTAMLDSTASSDPDGDALTYSWTQVSGPQVTISTVAPGVAQFQAPNTPVVLVFALTVSDGEATSVAINVTVNVVAIAPPNRAPIVTVGPSFDTPRRSPVTLNASAFDPEYNFPITFSWQQVSGPAVTLSGADTQYPTFVAPETPARLKFAVRASDGLLTSQPAEVEVNVRNFAPDVFSATLTPGAPHTNDTLVVDAQAHDLDNDSLTITYEWRRNGTLVAAQTSNTFPASLTTRGDVIAARVIVDDGSAQATIDASTSILDSPAVLSVQTPPPTAVNYGDTVSFAVAATDADGDAIPGFDVAFGPAGFDVTDQGNVTWIAVGPMFDRVTDFNWAIRVAGDDSSLLTGTFEVTDATRLYPLRRTDTAIPVQHNGLRIADLDGDGDREMLVGSSQALYVLSKSGAAYRQAWAYPFGVGGNDYTNVMSSVEASDIDGDGRQEIFFSKGTELVRLDGVARREMARTALRCRALEAADLDGNGSRELICLAQVGTDYYPSLLRIVVLNPDTLAELWSTPELPLGTTIAVGNVDNDTAPEIVAAGGYVFDGQTHQNQWAYSQAFGAAVDTGDMDGDGIQEIIGVADGAAVRAFSAINRSLLWEYVPSSYVDFDALTVADANGDGRVEAVVGNGQWGNVMGVGYNTTTHLPELLWQINSQDYGVSSIAVGDVDADGVNEVVWGSGAGSSGSDDFVIAGFTPTISVKWQSSSGAQLDGPFLGGALARIGAGASRLMFITPRTNSGYSGLRAVALNPTTAEIEISSEIGTNWSYAAALDVADYDNDNVDELFIATANLYDGYFAAYDFAADTREWQSPQLSSASGKSIAHADMNGDGYADLVGLTTSGYIDIYDVHAQSLLWRSTRLVNAVALTLADLDNDGDQEIIVALSDRIVVYGQATLGSGYVERASVNLTSAIDLIVADLNGDNDKEIYVLRSEFWMGAATLNVLDRQLQPVRSMPLGLPASALFVEESAFARKNLLLAVAGSYPANTISEIWTIDPVTGADVWRSPPLAGSIQRNSLYFVDVDGDGDREITFGTSGGMFHTR